jgi:superfamily I DNA/RNA helicase
MTNEKGVFPITHDVYLKLWALSKPRLNYDFILCDEFQDTNAVVLGVVTRQKCQQIYVGDKFQQIYAWRGAINALDQIEAKEFYLTKSFRFGQAIADMANSILGSYMPPEKRPPQIIGFERQPSEVVYASPEGKIPDAIICRTNAGVISEVFRYLNGTTKVYVQGGVDQMVGILNGAKDLMNGKRSYNPELALFNNWDEVIEFSETDSGMDLRSLVAMISDYGIEKLLEALRSTVKSSSEADITLTTAHKSKGLEWPHVKLHNDFFSAEEGNRLPQGEINILYVAATRALNLLDVSDCSACHPEVLKFARDSF